MKNFLHLTWAGVKKGLLTPTLPKETLTFQLRPEIRILRVIGGLSLIALISNQHLKFSGFILYIEFFFVILFTIYNFYIAIKRFKHMKKTIKGEELNVKNSPLSRSATILAKGIWCVKGVCEYAPQAGLTIGTMVGVDQILKNSGRESFFAPLILGTIKNYYFSFPREDKLNLKTGSLSSYDNVLEENKNIIKNSVLITFIKNNRLPFWLIQILKIVISLICLNYLFDYSNVNNDNVIKSINLNNLVYVKIFFMLGVFTSFMIISYYIVSLFLFIRFSKVIRTNNKDKIDNLIPTYLPVFIFKWLNLIKSLSHSSDASKGLFIEIYLRLILIYMLIFLSTIFVLIQLIKI